MKNPDELNLLEFLQQHRRGALLGEASERLHELLLAIGETGGAGVLTLKLPFKMNKAGQLECTPTVEVKKPARALGTGLYFLNRDEGTLSRRDPNQMDLEDEIARRRESKAAE